MFSDSDSDSDSGLQLSEDARRKREVRRERNKMAARRTRERRRQREKRLGSVRYVIRSFLLVLFCALPAPAGSAWCTRLTCPAVLFLAFAPGPCPFLEHIGELLKYA